MCDINVICTVRPGYRCDPEIRGRLLIWQGNGTAQVLRCTLYAGVLSLYRMTLPRAEDRLEFTRILKFRAAIHIKFSEFLIMEICVQQRQALVVAPMPTRKLSSQTNK